MKKVFFAAIAMAISSLGLGQSLGLREALEGKSISVSYGLLRTTGDWAEYTDGATGVNVDFGSDFKFLGSRLRAMIGIGFYNFSSYTNSQMLYTDYLTESAAQDFFFDAPANATGTVTYNDMSLVSLHMAYDVAIIAEKRFEPFVGVQLGFNVLSGTYSFNQTNAGEFDVPIQSMVLVEGGSLNIRPRVGAEYQVFAGLRVFGMYTYNRFKAEPLTFPHASHLVNFGLTYVFGDNLDF